jgi:hypothetical protein
MKYFDIYMESATLGDIKAENSIKEGHAMNQIYARVPVVDKQLRLITYLCRVEEDQMRYIIKTGIPYATWDSVSLLGIRSAIKIKIKNKNNVDKSIPTMLFGDVLCSPGCAVVTAGKNVDPATIVQMPPPLVEVGLP